jgi:polar amino acid transport system permease protein
MSYELHFSDVWRNFDVLLRGAWLTVQLATIAILLGFIIGVVCAMLRSVYPKLFVPVIEAYVQIIRNTPFLIQIVLVYFGFPRIGIRLDAYEAAVSALVLNVGAYASEIIRGGVESIPRGQIESGLALGLRRIQIFWLVVLQPALQTIYPALTSQFVLVMLSSSVLSVISAEELTAVSNNLISQTFRTTEVYLVVALIYLVLTLSFSGFFAILGRLLYRNQRSSS